QDDSGSGGSGSGGNGSGGNGSGGSGSGGSGSGGFALLIVLFILLIIIGASCWGGFVGC
ncbi:YjcZ family sporulation protein, partial [Bacillus thuringiensis]|uniref:YjcZ family sporulation protein n=1 Tax=Bacillus thuringiensis TaxID=1428 RepID=UPI0018CEA34C